MRFSAVAACALKRKEERAKIKIRSPLAHDFP